jgi:Superfamily II DNA/RNA helicases, SNF2 family
MFITIAEHGYTLDAPNECEYQKEYDADSAAFVYHLALKGTIIDDLSLSFLISIASRAIEHIVCQVDVEVKRDEVDVSFGDEEISRIIDSRPFLIGDSFVTHSWCEEMLLSFVDVFRREIKTHKGTVESYFASASDSFHVANRIFFHLVENRNGESPFAFLATYANSSKRHIPLSASLEEFKNDTKGLLALLTPLSRISEESGFISSLIDSGELFHPISLSAEEAYTFLREIPIYEKSGVYCRIPNFWKKGYRSASVSATVGPKNKSHFGLGAIMSFNPGFVLSGVEFSREEILELLSQKQGLRLIKGRWIEVDHEKLRALLERSDELDGEEFSFQDILQLEMGLKGKKDADLEISNSAFVNSLMKNLRNPASLERPILPSTFNGTLRGYQTDGVAYLDAMAQYRLGACLADDMGLGKTIQVICHIGQLLEKEGGRVLLIVPVSLVGNWEKEFERFLPSVKPIILTGQSKVVKGMDLSCSGVYITTYSLLSKLENVKSVLWDLSVIDEAQAIKNSSSAMSRAVRSIKAKERIALTGTPVENRVGDLWSLFDYLNPGLLGTKKEFNVYSKNLAESGSYAPLRKVISPFILRRMKSDKSIIPDLPDKIEEKAYPVLTPLQRELYASTVDTLAEKLEEEDSEIARKGLVLSTLMKLKQICNHPSQYSGDSLSGYEEEQSGKFLLLREIASSIFSRHERVLVFTQFKEVIPALDALLASVFGEKGLIIHGDVKAEERTALVERFNAPHYCPYMILSLKAGGVGLNLQAANHVIHFDRWWNPAVENQATDRAYRIGQRKNVVVHTFITKGTIEENIDTLLEEKKELANSLLSSAGESWITEMSNKEIIRLCTLEGVNG